MQFYQQKRVVILCKSEMSHKKLNNLQIPLKVELTTLFQFFNFSFMFLHFCLQLLGLFWNCCFSCWVASIFYQDFRGSLYFEFFNRQYDAGVLFEGNYGFICQKIGKWAEYSKKLHEIAKNCNLFLRIILGGVFAYLLKFLVPGMREIYSNCIGSCYALNNSLWYFNIFQTWYLILKMEESFICLHKNILTFCNTVPIKLI